MKTFLFILLIVLITIQFIKPQKNIHTGKQANDISTIYAVPANVDSILYVACNDCHSNNTRYPWYNNIQPIAWWMNDHINTGKDELNFNEFATYKISRQYDRMKSIKYQVKKEKMPLPSYTIIHKNALLTNAQKNTIEEWSEEIIKQMETKYPQDSLKEPQENNR